MTWRPKTLAEIPTRAAKGEDFSMLTREFVDEVLNMSAEQATAAVSEEPQASSNPVHKAWLAAMAEHYARKMGGVVPAWSMGADCFLDMPHFGTSLQSLKAHLLISSPPAFRRRMIFVERDPIPRAPRPGEFTQRPRGRVAGIIPAK